ncbi:MAG: hypothetical protein ABEL51_13665 [Salinibacter sp.]
MATYTSQDKAVVMAASPLIVAVCMARRISQRAGRRLWINSLPGRLWLKKKTITALDIYL